MLHQKLVLFVSKKPPVGPTSWRSSVVRVLPAVVFLL